MKKKSVLLICFVLSTMLLLCSCNNANKDTLDENTASQISALQESKALTEAEEYSEFNQAVYQTKPDFSSESESNEDKEKCALCNAKPKSGSLYCSSHCCNTFGCVDKKENGSYYCINHKCQQCNSERKGNSLYCASHKCAWYQDCANAREENSQYCIEHKCAYPNCNMRKESNSPYCISHKN